MKDFIQGTGLLDNVAIVVGAGQEIGRSCSLLLAEAGANVVVVDLSASLADSVANDIQTIGS